MRSWIVFLLLAGIGAVLPTTHAEPFCDMTYRNSKKPFPDLEEESVLGHTMSVEFTTYDLAQTDYYTEYYDTIEGKGRLESFRHGEKLKYIYSAETFEGWEITDQECNLKNMTHVPKMLLNLEDLQMKDWFYKPADREFLWRIGPSAMFRFASDNWNSGKSRTMAYMGSDGQKIRGLDTVKWRICMNNGLAYADYYFARDTVAFGEKILKSVPLRVVFEGPRDGDFTSATDKQIYDILTYQPYNMLGSEAFNLPKDKACRRGFWVDDLPEVPNFQDQDLMFGAEVVYKKVDRNGVDVQYWSYYSTLMYVLDNFSKHLAYHYTPWAGKKTEDEPLAPMFTVYDLKHKYSYDTDLETGKCTINRKSSYYPGFNLPEDGGTISLEDFSILYPGSETTFVTEATKRGLKVNVFENNLASFFLGKDGKQIPITNANITHSYLQDNEVERTTADTKNALIQIEIRFSRVENVIEVITLNFFGFTTQLRMRRNIFNIKRCFKNDDDYAWVTLGFHADPNVIEKVKNDVPVIESQIYNSLSMGSDLNAVRMPIIMVDVKDSINVVMMVLEKPPVILDFIAPSETGKCITGGVEDGMEDLDTCAQNCLENQDNCWGFSIEGTVCMYGVGKNAKVVDKVGCELYRRFSNDSFIFSLDKLVENFKTKVGEGDIHLMLRGTDGSMNQLDAVSINVEKPGEDEVLFDRVGNKLNERMNVIKAGYKLKKDVGKVVTNMGKLRYEECQKICLDYRDCDTASYCLQLQPNFGSQCILSDRYGDDIKPEEMEKDTMCSIVSRDYSDHFVHVPGMVLSVTAQENVKEATTTAGCAKACLKQSKYQCLSFDHCPEDTEAPCRLHTVHYPNANTREAVKEKSVSCGHYYRKFSNEFKKFVQTRRVGSSVPALNNITLEECAKTCVEYGKGICYGYDFCQGDTISATSCILFDKDPAQMKTMKSPICNSFTRSDPQYTPKPYTLGYAGGIGFLCFLIGGLVGALIVFGIAYIRVNRR